jgi:hypothetical protein
MRSSPGEYTTSQHQGQGRKESGHCACLERRLQPEPAPGFLGRRLQPDPARHDVPPPCLLGVEILAGASPPQMHHSRALLEWGLQPEPALPRCTALARARRGGLFRNPPSRELANASGPRVRQAKPSDQGPLRAPSASRGLSPGLLPIVFSSMMGRSTPQVAAGPRDRLGCHSQE